MAEQRTKSEKIELILRDNFKSILESNLDLKKANVDNCKEVADNLDLDIIIDFLVGYME